MGIVSLEVILNQLRNIEKDVFLLENKLVRSFDQAECELIEQSRKEVFDLEEKWMKIGQTARTIEEINANIVGL